MEGKLSLRASVTSELYFDNVKLPKDALLPKSEGLKSALGCLTQARYGIAWGVLGAAEACFDEAVGYVKDRVTFKKPIGHTQLVQAKLATMISRITQGKLLAFRLGQLKNEGKLHFGHVSMGKQNNCEMALQVARGCRDMLGGSVRKAMYYVWTQDYNGMTMWAGWIRSGFFFKLLFAFFIIFSAFDLLRA